MKPSRLLGALFAASLLAAPARATEQASYVMPGAGPMSMATFVGTYLNPALRALASCSWGTSAPANGPGAAPLPYQCWVDTTADPAVVKYFVGSTWVTAAKAAIGSPSWTPSYRGTDMGNASTATTGTSGHVLGFLDTANTYSAIQSGATAAVDTSSTQFATLAFVLNQAASATPLIDGTAAVGISTRFARADHIHPTDTTRAPLASPALTGTPSAPTAAPGTNTTQLATTAYADAIAALKANIASPTFTGTPAAPTAAVDTNTTQLADTAFVIGQAASATPLIDGTAAVGTSTRFARADHVHPTDTTRAPLASPTFTGVPAAPTASPGTNTTQLATTAYADAIAALKANAARNVSTGCGLAGGGDLSADRTLRLSLTVNPQAGTSYTVADGDCGKVIRFNNASAVSASLPQANGSTFVSGWSADFQNIGAGTVTVTPVTSTINGGASIALTQNQGMHCDSDGSNYTCVLGVGAAGGSGTVTNVATAEGLSGGPITSTGTISIADAYRRNIILTSIRDAKSLGQVEPIVNGVSDGFGGTDGVNAGASSGYSLDTTNKRVINTVGADTYATTVDPSLTSNITGYGGFTIVQQIKAAALSTNGDKVRLTLTPPSTGNNTVINKVYIGKEGTAPNFDGGQVQVTFSGGSNGATLVAGGASVVSDPITFTFDHTADILISFEFGATTDIRRLISAGSNYNLWEKAAAAESGLTTKSGYTNDGAFIFVIDLLEVRTAAGTPNNMIVVENVYSSLDFVPSTLRVSALLEPVDAATLNTDATLEVSRDGANWAAASLVQYHTLGTKTLVESAAISVTGQPSAATPAFRYKTFNNKRVYLHGVTITAAP